MRQRYSLALPFDPSDSILPVAGKYLHGHNVTSTPLPREKATPAGARPPADLADVEPRYLLLGLDRSLPLLSHAPASAERIYADGCPGPSSRPASDAESLLPFRLGVFDFALSIATIHHFSTPVRRRHGVEAIIRCLLPGRPGSTGRMLLYVWAHEQGESSRRRWEKGTLLAADVPPGAEPNSSSSDISSSDAAPRPQDVFVPWTTSQQADAADEEPAQPRTLNRYYHLFRSGELQDLVRQAAEALNLRYVPYGEDGDRFSSSGCGWVKVVKEGYEADNHFVECEIGR